MDRQYQIALINVPFDNTYSNTIRFDTRAEQEGYFDVNNLSFSAPINFNFGSLLETSVVYRDNSITSIDLLNKNYAIIKETINGISKYLYFFIRRAVFDTLSQINVGLELDVIQTFYIDINFQDCIIEKAHLDRFVGSSLHYFNSRDDSPLFIREDIKDISKRVIHREKIHFQYDTTISSGSGLTPFNIWVRDNVLAWVYIYIANTKGGEEGEVIGYKTYEWTNLWEDEPSVITNNFTTTINFPSGNYECPYSVLCFPLLKPDKEISLRVSGKEVRYSPHSEAFRSFLEHNNGGANILQIKFSTIAPFLPSNYSIGNVEGTYNIVDGTLELTCNSLIGGGWGWHGSQVICTENYYNLALFQVYAQDYKPLKSIRYNTHAIASKYFSSLKLHAGSVEKDPRYNPKLHNSDYMSLRVCAEGNYFDYDYQKLRSETDIYFLYSEVFTPDITRGYLRLATSHWSDSVYRQETEYNYMGLVFSQDYSLPYSRNQLDVFLANNKNFYQQRNLQMGQQIVDTTAGAIGGAGKAVSTAFSNPAGAVGIGVETIANTGAGITRIVTDRIQSNLTLDNMRSAPEQLANSNGNALLNMFVTEIGMYYEIHKGLDSELKIANDIMYKNGYTYNQVDNIKNVDNIRQYFNYVVAHVDNINSPLSNEIKAKIRSIFSNGIRFWNLTDEMFKFEKENFERYLYE